MLYNLSITVILMVNNNRNVRVSFLMLLIKKLLLLFFYLVNISYKSFCLSVGKLVWPRFNFDFSQLNSINEEFITKY